MRLLAILALAALSVLGLPAAAAAGTFDCSYTKTYVVAPGEAVVIYLDRSDDVSAFWVPPRYGSARYVDPHRVIYTARADIFQTGGSDSILFRFPGNAACTARIKVHPDYAQGPVRQAALLSPGSGPADPRPALIDRAWPGLIDALASAAP